MEILKKDFSVLSSDGKHILAGRVFLPSGEIKGFFHVVHGMTEYIGRYEKIMTDMAELGYLAFGYDNLGHGKTAADDSELGYIAPKNGWDLLLRDVKVFSDAVFAEFGRKDQPYVLMGHSMGSFIVRLATEKYVGPDKLIIMGTGGANPAAGAGLALIAVIKAIRGGKHISPLVLSLALGNNNKRFADENDPGSWITTDVSVRDKYRNDKYCTFKFTVSAMGDLISLLKNCNRSAWFKNMPKDLPILLVSGEDDPIGNFGKGVTEVYNKLKAQGAKVEYKLYKGARHEILNDFTYGEVKNDILDFVENGGGMK